MRSRAEQNSFRKHRLRPLLLKNEKQMETLYEQREQHGFATEEARFRLYEEIGVFLSKHL